jgi:apolipoprotein N-acyltransferase
MPFRLNESLRWPRRSVVAGLYDRSEFRGTVMPSPSSAGPRPHPTGLAIGSALLLWSAFPPADWGWLAWVGLVPLLLLVKSPRRGRVLYASAWLGGMVFWTLAIQWVRLSDATAWLAWLAMAFGLSIFWPVFLSLTRLAVLRLRLPLMIAAPVVWVGLEYGRAYFLTGFPWYYLAHSQHTALPLIQIADMTGSLGVSFVIVAVNAWLVELITLPLLRPTPHGPRPTRPQWLRFAVVVTLILGSLAYGIFRLGTARFRPGPRVALLQSSLIQRYKSSLDHNQILGIYQGLVARALAAPNRPDLIVWPETSWPFQFVVTDPKLSPKEIESQARLVYPEATFAAWCEKRDSSSRFLHEWTDRIGVPMLVGTVTYDHRPAGLSRYNSAILFRPGDAAIQSYHKMHLVPFGEYVPLIGVFPWLTVFTPYSNGYIPSLTPGREPLWLTLGPYRLATAICFEDTVPHVVRRFFSHAPDGRHPDLVLNLSNDGWFHDSSEHAMHLVVSVFRAIENRVPLARAANTGVSAIVDGNGRVTASLPTLRENSLSVSAPSTRRITPTNPSPGYLQDTLIGEVPLDDRESLYSHWGDWLGLTCLAITLGLGPLSWFEARSRRRLDG